MSVHGAWEILECDWAQTATGLLLHHVKSLVSPIRFDDEGLGRGTTTCGVRTTLNVPGLFSRMGELRCKKCCRKLGIPDGFGSPKNDIKLRPFLNERLERLKGGG